MDRLAQTGLHDEGNRPFRDYANAPKNRYLHSYLYYKNQILNTVYENKFFKNQIKITNIMCDKT